jgi:hypothetical protein
LIARPDVFTRFSFSRSSALSACYVVRSKFCYWMISINVRGGKAASCYTVDTWVEKARDALTIVRLFAPKMVDRSC